MVLKHGTVLELYTYVRSTRERRIQQWENRIVSSSSSIYLYIHRMLYQSTRTGFNLNLKDSSRLM